jgi:hypothetical protein
LDKVKFPDSPEGYSYTVTFLKPGASEVLTTPADTALAAALRNALIQVKVDVKWGGVLMGMKSIRLTTILGTNSRS